MANQGIKYNQISLDRAVHTGLEWSLGHYAISIKMASKSPKCHSPLDSLQTGNSEDTSAMDRDYEFFVTTEEPHQPNGQDRGRIRRMVMKNFFETKGSESGNTTSEQNSKETVQKKTKLKSRFRLSKALEDVAAQPPSRLKARNAARQHVSGRKEARSTISWESSNESQERSGSSTLSRRTSLGDSTDSIGGKSKSVTKIILRIEPGAHKFDPFDVLPVPGTPQLDTLLRLCESTSPFYHLPGVIFDMLL